MDAVVAAKGVFKNRNIGADQLPPASAPKLPLDEAAEGYAQFDAGAAQKFVIDPHGMVS